MTDTPAAAGTLVERLRNRNVPPSNNLNVEAAEELAEQQRVIDAQYEQLSACRAELAVKSKQHVEAHANCSELFKTVCEISQLTPLHGEVDEYAAVVEAVRAIVAAKEESERLLAAADRDAGRYRLLRASVPEPGNFWVTWGWLPGKAFWGGDNLDRAIDAALASKDSPK